MVKILIAKSQDIEELNEIAFAAKASWGYPKHYLATWQEELTVQIEMIQSKRIFKAVNEKNTTLGFYGLKNNPPVLILEGFWVKPREMGKGIGKMLFQHMIKTARFLQARSVEWESDPHAYDFYCHMGAKKIGQKIYTLCGAERILPIMQYEIDPYC